MLFITYHQVNENQSNHEISPQTSMIGPHKKNKMKIIKLCPANGRKGILIHWKKAVPNSCSVMSNTCISLRATEAGEELAWVKWERQESGWGWRLQFNWARSLGD